MQLFQEYCNNFTLIAQKVSQILRIQTSYPDKAYCQQQRSQTSERMIGEQNISDDSYLLSQKSQSSFAQ